MIDYVSVRVSVYLYCCGTLFHQNKACQELGVGPLTR